MQKMTQPKLYTRGTKLWIRFSLNGEVIKKSLNIEDNKVNRKLANSQIIPQLILKVNTGEFFENDKLKIPTVDEYIKVSFELQKGNRSDSTQYAYINNYKKHIQDIFGHRKLDSIKSNDITLWQNNLQANKYLAKTSILKIRAVLNTMFEDAIDDELISINPITRSKKLKQTEHTKVTRIRLKPFNSNEIKSILNATTGQSQNLIATLLFTGIRIGECIGLKWNCIDFKKKTISIRHQIVNGVAKDILKTLKSQRTIPIIDVLYPYLKKQYQLTGEKDSYIFLTQVRQKHYHSGTKIREQIWVKALKNAKVEYRNLHQTRGTFISTLISNGEDINYVSKIAGHENVKVTLENYSEYIPHKNTDFGKCFNQL